MQVHYDLESLPHFHNAVVTIGTFDGVHRGHQQVIESLKQTAKSIGGETVLISFHPHPRKIVNAAMPLHLINTQEEKITLLAQHGIDHLVIVPFTEAFAQMQAEAYITEFLVQRFRPHTIIIGYDHQFGKDRKGDYGLLKKFAEQYHFTLKEIPQRLINEIAISSTKIRQAILTSDVATANQLLGYPFFFSGLVVSGDQIGRSIGYPTANLEYTHIDKIRLGHGVFAATAHWKNRLFKGMLSIGNRPTLHNSAEKVEINLFDFDENLYGEVLQVQVHHYLRGQEKYDSMDILKSQLAKDKEDSLRWLA